ncbi:phage portal protein [Bradyrhizobium quebecense]|uniref:Phage portal protein n=1 Tax=Bradyrhizobium quebecense TaxID=2748629 RepID=A0A974AAZ8_9BRAD|nr:phage portal protein [Bradyrhizobium quebecense]UGA46655.1 phage portal protein [Bradyrhizobium quebecense]
MLNDAGGYGPGEKDEREAPTDADGIFSKLQKWCKTDFNSKGQTAWRTAAREDFDFEAGEQLTEDDKAILQDAKRPIVIFNRVGPVVDSVAGQEVGNRQEVQFLPRTEGDVQVNELLTSAAKWFRQQCDAEDEESDAFRDMVVCGMGWTETLLDYEDNPEGDPKIERRDPLEMVWDSGASKRNLRDMRRVFHIRRGVPLDEARALCPGDPDRPFEDADYNASWIDDVGAKDEGKPHENDNRFYNKDSTGDGEDSGDGVTMVRAQWWERVPVYLVLDPTDPTGEKILTLDKDEFEDLSAKAKLAGGSLRFTKSTRKVYRQAYLGSVLLEIGDAPCEGHFSFQCMTGKRDRNKNTFFGLVRAMKDPARWSNKWMSQTMHIMNTTAKGGVAVERGQFFDNDADGEASWAKQDTVTFLKPGALGSSPKFVQKPTSQFPQSSFELMQYAVTSLRDVSGVNVEILGMQSAAGQAASLDLQRKQSALTILQPLFDSLRRYRKSQGRLMLYLIEHYLSDGRLIKIEGEENAQYVPLVKQQATTGASQYDVIVDESPTSANQKEATWSMLQQLLPVIGKMLPPATWLALLKYSPLPTSAQKAISDSIQQSQQQPDPEQQKRDAELKLENDKAQAKIANDKAASDAKVQTMQQESAAKMQLAAQEAQHSAMLKALTAPPTVDPATGQPVPGSGGGETAALIMAFMQEMRRDMNTLATALNTPKKLIRDPQTGEIVGIAPVGTN